MNNKGDPFTIAVKRYAGSTASCCRDAHIANLIWRTSTPVRFRLFAQGFGIINAPQHLRAPERLMAIPKSMMLFFMLSPSDWRYFRSWRSEHIDEDCANRQRPDVLKKSDRAGARPTRFRQMRRHVVIDGTSAGHMAWEPTAHHRFISSCDHVATRRSNAASPA